MKRVVLFSLVALCCLLAVLPGRAQDTALLLHYTFEGVDGTTVPDRSQSGVDARLMNQATVMSMGKYHVMDLGHGTGYLDLTAAAGKTVRNLGDFTVSAYYRVDAAASLSGAGFFLWAFSQSSANTQTASPYSAYRLNAQRMATSTGGWGNETGLEIGSAAEKDRWTHVLYRQTGTKGELYLNGQLQKSLSGMPLLKNAFTAAPAYNWIGRAPFASDAYLTRTLVYDFRLYGVAVSDEEIARLAAVSEELEYEFKYGTPGDFSQLVEIVDQCVALIQTSAADYPVNAIAELQDGVLQAQAEIAAGQNTQYFIDQRVAALRSKLASVKALQGVSMPESSAISSADHGFIHPGALHTQADFERIKQLLADGNPTIKAAYNALKAGEYAQSGIATWPVETIVRGGSSGQNYMNVARGAAMAYQNALVWKISGETAHADAAVRILMAWARGNKYVGGDTNKSLAAGIYGYQLANAAELMRDYEGWSAEDFAEFKDYILKTWYPVTVDFMRRRHGTWDNSGNPGAGGQRPGHYWSNWGLCNALALMSYGVLLDDVHIYNQGISFYKYDHVGTFNAASTVDRTEEMQNKGLTEFIGNLVPVVHHDERGPFGFLGQMQETGRDAGHEQMALGLAADICQIGLNQGEDLFAYMDNRLAAGIEYVAARNYGGLTDLPWTTYRYCDCRTAWHNGWVMGAASGAAANNRPFWDRILGYYEGMRGVEMKYSRLAAKALRGSAGYDMGGHSYGENSGGYDHLGFSTLTCYRPEMAAPENVPPILSGKMEYKGVIHEQTNLGGLKYTFQNDGTKALPADGAEIRLIPILPDGETDSGSWLWNTGETTREITVKADKSYIYRVSYTAGNGAVAQQMFSIAVAGDCSYEPIRREIAVAETTYADTVAQVVYGNEVTLRMDSYTGYGQYLWDNGETTNVVTVPYLTSDRVYTGHYTNQGGFVNAARFTLRVVSAEPYMEVGGKTYQTDRIIVSPGTSLRLGVQLSSLLSEEDVVWNDGSIGSTYEIDAANVSADYTATIRQDGQETVFTYHVYVKMAKDPFYETGNYRLRDVASGRYLTHTADGKSPSFLPLDVDNQGQVWEIARLVRPNYFFISALDRQYLSKTGEMVKGLMARPFFIKGAEGSDRVIVCSHDEDNVLLYWKTLPDGCIEYQSTSELYDFPYLLEKVQEPDGIEEVAGDESEEPLSVEYLTPDGVLLDAPRSGVNIVRKTYPNRTMKIEKKMLF